MLRQKLKEAEMHADQDRYLRNKLSDDSSHLVKENALLNQQVLELQKQLDRVSSQQTLQMLLEIDWCYIRGSTCMGCPSGRNHVASENLRRYSHQVTLTLDYTKEPGLLKRLRLKLI